MTTDLQNSNIADNFLFYLWTGKTSPLKSLAELLKDLLNEGNLICSKDSIKLFSMSANQTLLVHLKLNASEFEKYICNETISLGINMDNYFKIIKLIETNELLRLYVEKDEPYLLAIERFNKEENIQNTNYLKLMDIPNELPFIPELQYNQIIVMNSARFQKICKEIYTFNDYVKIECHNGILYFKSKCSKNKVNSNKQTIKIIPSNNNNDENNIKYEANDNEIFEGTYNLKYLVQFSKCSNLSNTVKLHIGNDLPLLVECDVAKMGNIRICIMPIDEDDL